MTCFYQSDLPAESICRERRQQRRLLPHRNLWPGCGKCGVVLGAKPKETSTGNPVDHKTYRGEKTVSHSGRPGTAGEKRDDRNRPISTTRRRISIAPATVPIEEQEHEGHGNGKHAPRSGRMYSSFSGGPAPKNAPQATTAPERPTSRVRTEYPAVGSPEEKALPYWKRRYPCPNCGHLISRNHSACTPCEKIKKRLKGNMEEMLKAFEELKERRKAGAIKRGRPVDPQGVHRGWPRGVARKVAVNE